MSVTVPIEPEQTSVVQQERCQHNRELDPGPLYSVRRPGHDYREENQGTAPFWRKVE